MDSQISLQSGQTGNFSGARLGTQTLPQRATTGVPITIASVSLSLGTKCENRSWSPSSVGTVRSSCRTSVSTAVPDPNPMVLIGPNLRLGWSQHGLRGSTRRSGRELSPTRCSTTIDV